MQKGPGKRDRRHALAVPRTGRPVPCPAMPPVFPLLLLVLSQSTDTSWSANASPCVDSLLVDADMEIMGGFDWGSGSFGSPVAVEDCDAEESLLFTGDRASEIPRRRESARAVFSMTRSAGGALRSTTRHTAARKGWEDRIEWRDDGATRWRLGYTGAGWRAVLGEMTDTSLPAWPRALPHRALPAGWQSARGTEEHPLSLSAPVPQGVAVGAWHSRWKAYALSAWNPVETGHEPPWSGAWDFRHAALGASVSLPWVAGFHLSETRIARGGSDTLSERLFAASLASPAQSPVGFEATAARVESDAARSGGWSLATMARLRVERGGEVAMSMRQRTRGWASAWDPAVPDEDAYGIAKESDTDEETAEGRWGAGEARVSGRIPFRNEGALRERTAGASGYARGEAWSVWNPGAASGAVRQRGVRAAVGRRLGDVRVEISGTNRVARAASGSTGLYRLARADLQIESFPGWRAAAWRAWNGEGPLRNGVYLGAEPEWEGVRMAPGYRLEETTAGLEGRAAFEARIRLGEVDIGFSAALPCHPAPDAGSASWRLTVSTGR